MSEICDRIKRVLFVIKQSGLKHNKAKCSFRTSGLEFRGHWIDHDGASPHRAKIEAIKNSQSPKYVSELRRFLGLVNFMGRYMENLA